MPVPTRGAVFGVWKPASAGSYSANMWFYRFNADGTVAGTQKVERTLSLSTDANTLTGALTLQIIDPSGAIVQQGCGSEVSTRVSW